MKTAVFDSPIADELRRRVTEKYGIRAKDAKGAFGFKIDEKVIFIWHMEINDQVGLRFTGEDWYIGTLETMPYDAIMTRLDEIVQEKERKTA